MESHSSGQRIDFRLASWASPLVAAIILCLFGALLVSSSWNKSITCDELVPPVAGAAYWKFGDFRLDPENGNLPQRLAALPLLGYPLAPTTSPAWLAPSQWAFSDEWFHGTVKEHVPRILRLGRAASSVLAVALAAFVWYCSRQLFGPEGGMLSLLVCVFNPTILANGPLMTSDIASALFFLGATWTWWRLLRAFTLGQLVAAAFATSGLLLSKMSAGLLLPIVVLLTLVRLVGREPLEVRVWGRVWVLVTRGHRGAAFIAVGLTLSLIAYTTLWGFYNFRYSALAPNQPSQAGSTILWQGALDNPSLPELVEGLGLRGDVLKRARDVVNTPRVPIYGWNMAADEALAELQDKVLSPAQIATLRARKTQPVQSPVYRVVSFCAKHRIFPEAYLIGTVAAWRFAQLRPAFLNGEHYYIGKAWFFPYTFLVKTPLALMGIILLAAGAMVPRRHDPDWMRMKQILYESLPIWTVFVVYWIVALTTGLNIGHRHILPTYPPLFVLCGAAGVWLARWQATDTTGRGLWRGFSWRGWAVIVLLVVHALDITWRFPHYLAYFNGIISPQRAYRHFVDSTLDWGQDLPGVKTYIEMNRSQKPFYLSYFGNGDPRTYGIEASFLPSTPGRFRSNFAPLIFEPLLSNAPSADEISQLQLRFPQHEYIGVEIKEDRRCAVFSRRRETWQLTAGTYFISATSLQARYGENEESVYQTLRKITHPFLAPGPNAAEEIRRYSLVQWEGILLVYEGLRQARMTAFLRPYSPDDFVGYSILVFKVSEADIARALDGPAPFHPGYFDRTLSLRTMKK